MNESASDLSDVLPEPASRLFICASTRSGKSTLAEGLLETYRRKHRGHQIYIYDPKPRFLPVDPDESPLLFPDGYEERIIKKRRVVPIDGERVRRPHGNAPDGRAWLYTKHEDVLKLFTYLHDHPSADRPRVLFSDESFDYGEGGRFDPGFRKLMRQGGSAGVGMWTINQSPRWIDGTLLRETEYLYIGTLNDPEDRKHLAPHCMGTELWRTLEQPYPRFRWLFVNRLDWEKSRLFDMEI